MTVADGEGELLCWMMETDTLEEKIFEIPPSTGVVEKRHQIITRIEEIITDVVESLLRKEKPSINYNDGKNSGWIGKNSSNFDSDVSFHEGRIRTLRFIGQSHIRFALIFRVLSHVHEKLVKYLQSSSDEFYGTKRAFYYSLKNEDIKRFISYQRKVDWAIDDVLMILECSPWEIGFITTSKGLLSGDLTLYLDASKTITYTPESCQAVPDVLAEVCRIRTKAKFVLVVEKDSVFQQLLREQCPSFNKCVIITGKGYPDVPTRMLVRLLSEVAGLPVYALVDANPYGFDIMCVYRFGTSNNLGYRKQLICPEMRWLGIHHVDLLRLGIKKINLTKLDMKKIKDLMNRSYVDSDFLKHLNEMKEGKAEIESIIKTVPIDHFLTEILIPAKIRKKEYY